MLPVWSKVEQTATYITLPISLVYFLIILGGMECSNNYKHNIKHMDTCMHKLLLGPIELFTSLS